jgi:flavin reductase (DIM6/NTAB) family NADH-FMN oxidoreductase RutF
MELDLENQFADRAYPILASLVTPRPIALVTTMSPQGHVNAAPFSFFNVLGAHWRSLRATATTARRKTRR